MISRQQPKLSDIRSTLLREVNGASQSISQVSDVSLESVKHWFSQQQTNMTALLTGAKATSKQIEDIEKILNIQISSANTLEAMICALQIARLSCQRYPSTDKINALKEKLICAVANAANLFDPEENFWNKCQSFLESQGVIEPSDQPPYEKMLLMLSMREVEITDQAGIDQRINAMKESYAFFNDCCYDDSNICALWQDSSQSVPFFTGGGPKTSEEVTTRLTTWINATADHYDTLNFIEKFSSTNPAEQIAAACCNNPSLIQSVRDQSSANKKSVLSHIVAKIDELGEMKNLLTSSLSENEEGLSNELSTEHPLPKDTQSEQMRISSLNLSNFQRFAMRFGFFEDSAQRNLKIEHANELLEGLDNLFGEAKDLTYIAPEWQAVASKWEELSAKTQESEMVDVYSTVKALSSVIGRMHAATTVMQIKLQLMSPSFQAFLAEYVQKHQNQLGDILPLQQGIASPVLATNDTADMRVVSAYSSTQLAQIGIVSNLIDRHNANNELLRPNTGTYNRYWQRKNAIQSAVIGHLEGSFQLETKQGFPNWRNIQSSLINVAQLNSGPKLEKYRLTYSLERLNENPSTWEANKTYLITEDNSIKVYQAEQGKNQERVVLHEVSIPEPILQQLRQENNSDGELALCKHLEEVGRYPAASTAGSMLSRLNKMSEAGKTLYESPQQLLEFNTVIAKMMQSQMELPPCLFSVYLQTMRSNDQQRNTEAVFDALIRKLVQDETVRTEINQRFFSDNVKDQEAAIRRLTIYAIRAYMPPINIGLAQLLEALPLIQKMHTQIQSDSDHVKEEYKDLLSDDLVQEMARLYSAANEIQKEEIIAFLDLSCTDEQKNNFLYGSNSFLGAMANLSPDDADALTKKFPNISRQGSPDPVFQELNIEGRNTTDITDEVEQEQKTYLKNFFSTSSFALTTYTNQQDQKPTSKSGKRNAAVASIKNAIEKFSNNISAENAEQKFNELLQAVNAEKTVIAKEYRFFEKSKRKRGVWGSRLYDILDDFSIMLNKEKAAFSAQIKIFEENKKNELMALKATRIINAWDMKSTLPDVNIADVMQASTEELVSAALEKKLDAIDLSTADSSIIFQLACLCAANENLKNNLEQKISNTLVGFQVGSDIASQGSHQKIGLYKCYQLLVGGIPENLANISSKGVAAYKNQEVENVINDFKNKCIDDALCGNPDLLRNSKPLLESLSHVDSSAKVELGQNDEDYFLEMLRTIDEEKLKNGWSSLLLNAQNEETKNDFPVKPLTVNNIQSALLTAVKCAMLCENDNDKKGAYLTPISDLLSIESNNDLLFYIINNDGLSILFCRYFQLLQQPGEALKKLKNTIQLLQVLKKNLRGDNFKVMLRILKGSYPLDSSDVKRLIEAFGKFLNVSSDEMQNVSKKLKELCDNYSDINFERLLVKYRIQHQIEAHNQQYSSKKNQESYFIQLKEKLVQYYQWSERVNDGQDSACITHAKQILLAHECHQMITNLGGKYLSRKKIFERIEWGGGIENSRSTDVSDIRSSIGTNRESMLAQGQEIDKPTINLGLAEITFLNEGDSRNFVDKYEALKIYTALNLRPHISLEGVSQKLKKYLSEENNTGEDLRAAVLALFSQEDASSNRFIKQLGLMLIQDPKKREAYRILMNYEPSSSMINAEEGRKKQSSVLELMRGIIENPNDSLGNISEKLNNPGQIDTGGNYGRTLRDALHVLGVFQREELNQMIRAFGGEAIADAIVYHETFNKVFDCSLGDMFSPRQGMSIEVCRVAMLFQALSRVHNDQVGQYTQCLLDYLNKESEVQIWEDLARSVFGQIVQYTPTNKNDKLLLVCQHLGLALIRDPKRREMYQALMQYFPKNNDEAGLQKLKNAYDLMKLLVQAEFEPNAMWQFKVELAVQQRLMKDDQAGFYAGTTLKRVAQISRAQAIEATDERAVDIVYYLRQIEGAKEYEDSYMENQDLNLLKTFIFTKMRNFSADKNNEKTHTAYKKLGFYSVDRDDRKIYRMLMDYQSERRDAVGLEKSNDALRLMRLLLEGNREAFSHALDLSLKQYTKGNYFETLKVVKGLCSPESSVRLSNVHATFYSPESHHRESIGFRPSLE